MLYLLNKNGDKKGKEINSRYLVASKRWIEYIDM